MRTVHNTQWHKLFIEILSGLENQRNTMNRIDGTYQTVTTSSRTFDDVDVKSVTNVIVRQWNLHMVISTQQTIVIYVRALAR